MGVVSWVLSFRLWKIYYLDICAKSWDGISFHGTTLKISMTICPALP
jgi:hypothetical protein